MLAIRNLEKRYRERGRRGASVVAVDGLSLEVGQGHLFTLLGPSGCGKTTTLRCVAGLERPDAGEIAVAERVLFSSENGVEIAASDRGLGMVFQSYALWPHMTVFDTVAFPLTAVPRRRRASRREVRERVERALAVVRLEALAGRRATALSGGQQQRLALARALVIEPPLLLMDEPLSNLDAGLRDDMRFELKRLQREVGVTSVYVTHDQAEALALSNVVAVIRDGRIEQIGRPRDIYELPRSRFVAEFLGSANLVDGTVERRGNGGYVIGTPLGRIDASSAADFATGEAVVVAIRSEEVRIAPVDGDDPGSRDGRPNHWRGAVRARAFRGDAVDHVVGIGDAELRVRCPAQVTIRPGTSVSLEFDPDACTVLPEAA